jgi:hypothetical protein
MIANDAIQQQQICAMTLAVLYGKLPSAERGKENDADA